MTDTPSERVEQALAQVVRNVYAKDEPYIADSERLKHDLAALIAAVRAEERARVVEALWPNREHIGCDKQGDQWDDVLTCKCGLDRALALLSSKEPA
jgi:hypothetical protein